MRIRYFAETDTLHIEFRNVPVAETRDLDENTLLDRDAEGNISAITVEHASERAGIPEFSYQQVTACLTALRPASGTDIVPMQKLNSVRT